MPGHSNTNKSSKSFSYSACQLMLALQIFSMPSKCAKPTTPTTRPSCSSSDFAKTCTGSRGWTSNAQSPQNIHWRNGWTSCLISLVDQGPGNVGVDASQVVRHLVGSLPRLHHLHLCRDVPALIAAGAYVENESSINPPTEAPTMSSRLPGNLLNRSGWFAGGPISCMRSCHLKCWAMRCAVICCSWSPHTILAPTAISQDHQVLLLCVSDLQEERRVACYLSSLLPQCLP